MLSEGTFKKENIFIFQQKMKLSTCASFATLGKRLLIDGIRWIAPIKEVTREPRRSSTTRPTTSALTQMALSIIAQNALTSHQRDGSEQPKLPSVY